MATITLLLVRHGETVDNVARLYAGSQDSELTAHGVLQTRQLASCLVNRQPEIGPVTHIFSSDLRRAYLTAKAVRDAVHLSASSSGPPPLAPGDGLEILPLAELREKDFGSMEGRSGSSGPRPPGRDAAFVPPETHDAMELRISTFFENVLVPVLESLRSAAASQCVVVVAHGIILHRLYLFLLLRIVVGWDTSPAETEALFLDNTGYHELAMTFPGDDAAVQHRRPPYSFVAHVRGVNRRDHLAGLKKTRGGIGSARFDPKQKSIDAFFKKPGN